MAFQTPITIAQTITKISHNGYVLPAIQREFVWRPNQITALFDSLMRGYPIGTFLFWKVERERVEDFRFYQFLDHYHQRDMRSSDRWHPSVGNSGVTAVLDGQQRFTALNIGLRGSHASKRKWYRWDADHAFPKRRLFLNLKQQARANTDVENKYEFRFLTDERATTKDVDQHWFHPSRVLGWTSLKDVMKYLTEHSLWECDYSHSGLPFTTVRGRAPEPADQLLRGDGTRRREGPQHIHSRE